MQLHPAVCISYLFRYIILILKYVMMMKYVQEKAFDFTIPICCMELLDVDGALLF